MHTKMRIAAVFEENIFDQKGAFRAKLERIKHLREQEDMQVDVWCIQVRYTWIERLLLGKRMFQGIPESRLPKREVIEFDGIPFRMLWLDYSILDHFLFFKLKKRPVFYPWFLKRRSRLFRSYDLISGHSFEGGYLAREVQRRYGIPYCVSWHGSDIHTKPFKYPCIKDLTASILAGAQMNFFASQALLETSDRIGPGKKTVLYNGSDESFYRYDEPRRAEIRKSFDVREGTPVVGFAGNLEAVKNAGLLPGIFERIQGLYGAPLSFWVIGDGRLRQEIETRMRVPCRFWGNVPRDKMPGFLNGMDLLVLPSVNEGLPLVLLEAIRCGCRAVGSEVGGIPEALGPGYCVPLGEDFPDRFARKVVSVLQSPFVQSVPPGMSWEETAAKEADCYRKVKG